MGAKKLYTDTRPQRFYGLLSFIPETSRSAILQSDLKGKTLKTQEKERQKELYDLFVNGHSDSPFFGVIIVETVAEVFTPSQTDLSVGY